MWSRRHGWAPTSGEIWSRRARPATYGKAPRCAASVRARSATVHGTCSSAGSGGSGRRRSGRAPSVWLIHVGSRTSFSRPDRPCRCLPASAVPSDPATHRACGGGRRRHAAAAIRKERNVTDPRSLPLRDNLAFGRRKRPEDLDRRCRYFGYDVPPEVATRARADRIEREGS